MLPPLGLISLIGSLVLLILGQPPIKAVRHENGVKFWLITEADRSCTTVLLPEEY